MIRSLVLFVHITGVLTMFAGLALEAFGVESSGKATPRMFGLAVPLTVLSGFYLGARIGVLGNEWMRASYGGIVLMAAAGALARRSEELQRISLRARATFGLAVVFLMIAKPDAPASVVVLGLALGVSMLAALPNTQRAREYAPRFEHVSTEAWLSSSSTACATSGATPNNRAAWGAVSRSPGISTNSPRTRSATAATSSTEADG